MRLPYTVSKRFRLKALPLAPSSSKVLYRDTFRTVFTSLQDSSDSARRKKIVIEDANIANGKIAGDVTKLGAVVNVILAASKGAAAYAVGSTALFADAASSVGDLLTDAIVYFSVMESRKGRTAKNPWGKGKIEPLGTLAIGGLLLFTGFGLGATSIQVCYEVLVGVPPTADPNSLESVLAVSKEAYYAALGVSAFSVVSKEVLFRVSLKAGQQSNSTVVIANAWQHRSDVGTSSAVFAGLLGSYLGIKLLDPLAGFFVSWVIVKQALSTTMEAYKDLSDSPAEQEETDQLIETARKVIGVIEIQKLLARRSGPFLYVDTTVGVDGSISASAAHRIAELVKGSLLDKHTGRVANAVVHVNPLGSQGLGEQSPEEHRDREEIVQTVKSILKAQNTIKDVTDIQVYYRDSGKIALKIDVVMDDSLTIGLAHIQAFNAKKLINSKMPWIEEIDVDLELDEDRCDCA